MKIQISYSDGIHSWRTVEKGEEIEWEGQTVVDISVWRFWWLCAISSLARRMNRYLGKLDNEWYERNMK